MIATAGKAWVSDLGECLSLENVSMPPLNVLAADDADEESVQDSYSNGEHR